MSYTFSRTREQMRDMIARKLGVKEAGQELDAEDASIIFEAMDLRLKELHALGVLWWNVAGASTSIALTSGQVTATISESDYLLPVSLMLVVGNDEQPIELIGHSQYQAIEDKDSTGEPVKAFISGSTIRLWPVPQTGYTAKLTYQSIAADTEANTAPDVQVSMQRAFAAVVAGDLVDDFDVEAGKAARLIALQEHAIRTIRALNDQRVDVATVQAEYF